MASLTNASPSPVARLMALLTQERSEIGLVYTYAVFAGLLSLALPVGVQAIIGLVAGGMLLQPVVILIVAVVAGTALSGLLQLLQVSAVERLQQRIFARLAIDWGTRIPSLHPDAARAEHLPETVTRFFEVVIIQKALAKLLIEAVAAVLAIAFGLVLLALYHPSLSIAGVLLLGAFVVTLWFTGRHAYETSYEESTAKYRVAHWLQELARHFPLLRTAAPSALPLRRTDEDVATYLRARQAHFRVIVRQSVAAVVFKTLITGALLVLGTMLVVDRKITLGQFVASELVVVMILAGVEKLILNLGTVYDLLTGVTKAAHVSELPVLAESGGMTSPAAADTGSAVELRQLRYRYGSAPRVTLDDVSLSVAPGERLALIGPEGAGTSTLLQAIGGLLPTYEGRIALDGISLRDYTMSSLRTRVGFVDSSPAVIDGTLAENVALGRPSVSEDDVRWALDLAGLTDTVWELPHGIETPLGGTAVMPLEAVRRLALARAIVTRPSLLLIDSFFHHLSPEHKGALVAQLCDASHGWTIIGASHDPLFLGACDRIAIVEHGAIVRIETPKLLSEPAFLPHLILAHDDIR